MGDMTMQTGFAKEIAALKKLAVGDLKNKYAEVFRETTRASNKPWLIKRIAWRIQALAEGDLSERARQRAAELANDADLRLIPPKEAKPQQPSAMTPERTVAAPVHFSLDQRLPPPGAVLTRLYKGESHQVLV